MRRLETTYSTLVWSADGSQVTKSRPPGDYPRRRFKNELRINRLLVAEKPPVFTAALVAHEVQSRSLTFEALPGAPLGPKYAQELAGSDIDAILAMARELERYRPKRRWLRRIEPARRLALARNIGLLDNRDATALIALTHQRPGRLRFAHGDLTARNVLRGDGDLTLIDWEWAGLYPEAYDAAFLWYSLGEVEGGRGRVERSFIGDTQRLLLSALLIELWHLQWYVPREFEQRHLATRDELIDRLRSGR